MNVIFRDYGGGLVEYGFSTKDPALGGCRDHQDDSSPERLPCTEQEKAERAARRARTVIRRRIMSLGLDHLLTLTYRANMVDFGASVKDLRRFIRVVRDRFPGYRWVAIAERQKRGSIHWHIAVKGFQDVRFLRAAWLRIVGDGNIDVRGSNNRTRVGKLKLAYYLVKYISKNVQEHQEGAFRYYGSKDRGDVSIVKITLDRASGYLVWVKEILLAQGQEVRQTFDTAFGGWGATWESIRGGRIGILSCSA